ncbi:MAG: hypothetical protein ABI760_15395 [Ferruginibacter sp.]
MEKRIKIFKSFEEQEQFYDEEMRKTTPLQRFQNLFRMQQLTDLFHPPTKKARRIIIQKNGHSQ